MRRHTDHRNPSFDINRRRVDENTPPLHRRACGEDRIMHRPTVSWNMTAEHPCTPCGLAYTGPMLSSFKMAQHIGWMELTHCEQ
jgi:hypothetical protein